MKTLQDSEIGKDLPCLHCQLIAMGEMACYRDFCPQCGRIPPNLEGALRRLAVLEHVLVATFTATKTGSPITATKSS